MGPCPPNNQETVRWFVVLRRARHHISKALPCRQRTRGFGTRRTTPCQAPGEGGGVGWDEGGRGSEGGRGGGGRLQSASVLVAGRGARAHAMHEGLVGLALAGLGPPLAALVVVVAHRRAHLRREEGHTSACACSLTGGAAARRRRAGRRWARRGAHPARVRALLHHRERVVDALARIGPDLALRRVLVGALDALTHSAAVGALLVPAVR